MSVFNASTASVIFAHKILCLVGSVFGMYFFVRLVFIEPIVSFMFFIIMFNSVVFYSVMWDYVFTLPETVLEFKQQMTIKAREQGRDFRYYKRVAETMRCEGVKVGAFANMERNSTLIFLDFVSNSVASMLISF